MGAFTAERYDACRPHRIHERKADSEVVVEQKVGLVADITCRVRHR